MALQIESFDSGSNYSFGDKLEVPNVPRSLLQLGNTIETTVNNAGKIQALNWLRTLPNDDMDISANSILRVMPMKVPLYTRQRQYVYGFWSPEFNLWDNFHVFATKGYSGTSIHYEPTFNDGNLASDTEGKGIQPGSLGDMLGLPQGMTRAQIIGAGDISCLPFMFYFRIWRDYFVNKNYYMNDRIILPDDDSRFRVDDDGQLLSAKDQEYTLLIDLFSPSTKGIIYDHNNNTITVGIFYHEYPKDRFTSAFPSTQRGQEVTLPNHIGLSEVTKKLFTINCTGFTSQAKAGIELLNKSSTNTDILSLNSVDQYSAISADQINKYNNLFEEWLLSHPINSSTINEVRKAFIDQRILEKMAKTDGSFGEFALTLFGVKPKSAEDFRATYIGGTYKDIAFTEVVQSSPAVQYTDGNESILSSPLGSFAGHGISGMNDTYLGHLRSDDYGFFMMLTCIMPDVGYSQGLLKKWTLHSQEDLITPERCKLGMIPILNREVYYAGNNSNSSGGDNYLWAYQDYADEYRYQENIVSGKMADINNLSFSPFTQTRIFNSLPNWSKEFATATDVRKDYLQSEVEDAYSLSIAFDIRAVRPIPYRAEPASLGI